VRFGSTAGDGVTGGAARGDDVVATGVVGGPASVLGVSGAPIPIGAPEGRTSGWVAAWSPTGALRWAHGIVASGFAQSIEVAAEPGGVVVGGTFVGTLPLNGRTLSGVDPSSMVAFVARWTADGAPSWATAVGPQASVSDVVARPDGGAVAAGQASGPVVFGLGEPGEVALDGSVGPFAAAGWVAWFGADGRVETAATVSGASSAPRLARLPSGDVLVAHTVGPEAVFTTADGARVGGRFEDGPATALLSRWSPDGALRCAVVLASGLVTVEDLAVAADGRVEVALIAATGTLDGGPLAGPSPDAVWVTLDLAW
jgi:hypothetical protein